jgi:hypothetical protein
MKYYYEEILNGFTDLPCTSAPGVLIVTGEKAQAVFTGENPADVFLAASEYGNGRIFVSGHDCYYAWLKDKVEGSEGDFINSIKRWLTRGAGADDSNTIDTTKIKPDTDLSSHKLVIWHGSKAISVEVVEKVREFVENGGGLFCGMTLWGYLQNNKKAFDEIPMYVFLKNYAGIILTSKSCGMPKKAACCKNRAKYGNFNGAIDRVCEDAKQIPKYCETIDCCIDTLSRHGLVDLDSVEKMKLSLLSQCETNGWCPVPSKNSPVKVEEVKQVTKLLGRCYIELGEKAPNIEEFPFDYAELPTLLSDVEVALKPKYSERVSTGYHLPAGVEMIVKVTRGDTKGWKCRIGAHSDVIKPKDEYRRWPVCFVVKELKKEMVVRSPFGGLVYFDRFGTGLVKIKSSIYVYILVQISVNLILFYQMWLKHLFLMSQNLSILVIGKQTDKNLVYGRNLLAIIL